MPSEGYNLEMEMRRMIRRTGIILELGNPHDYNEYVTACEKEGIEDYFTLRQYPERVGRLLIATFMYPDNTGSEALQLLVGDMKKEDEVDEARVVIHKDSPTPRPKSSCCGRGKKSPPMLKKAKNYAKTMARWIKAGRPVVSMATLSHRLSICGGCDSLIKDRECSKCGCPMIEKAKMDIDKLCELNKW
jgi:hypothetical protein